MKTSDFDYYLPQGLIAQSPLEPRDRSRLMVLNRVDWEIEHRSFLDITSYLRAGDILVLNNSRVLPARLDGRKVDTGGRLEILLLRRSGNGTWEALVKPGRRVKPGTRIEIAGRASNEHKLALLAEVIEERPGGIKLLSFSDENLLPGLGKIPLPPYIHLPLADSQRYQTVYADSGGSVAAPTAGLHFTRKLLGKIQRMGVQCLFVTLHIGLDTFRPVKEEDPRQHPVYREYGLLDAEVAGKLCQARREGRRIICVGTTTVRLIEHVSRLEEGLAPFEGWVDLSVFPGYQFRVVDALITNFHLPRSTLLMLVTAFTGRDLLNQAYQEAIDQQYRFYSFGDAMLIF